MANIVLINTQGNGSHLSVANGELVVAAGQAKNEEQWKVNGVPLKENVFTIQHLSGLRFIQISNNGVTLVDNAGINCELTLGNGIANNTNISNQNIPAALFLGIEGNQIVPTNQEANATKWNIALV